MIYILSGDIRSGKTTALLNWINTSTTLSGTGRKDVDGLLCPDDEEGKRYFLKIKSNEKFPFEAEKGASDIIEIGPFRFLKSAFNQANDYLIQLAKEKGFQYLVVDEIGKLELKNKGLHDSAKVLIPEFISNKSKHLIIVVRTSLLDAVLIHYNIANHYIIEKAELQKLN